MNVDDSSIGGGQKRTRSNRLLNGNGNGNYEDQTTKKTKSNTNDNPLSTTEKDPFDGVTIEDRQWLDILISNVTSRFALIKDSEADAYEYDAIMTSTYKDDFDNKFDDYPTIQYNLVQRYLFCHLLKKMGEKNIAMSYFIKNSLENFDNVNQVCPFLDNITVQWVPSSWWSHPE